MRSLRSRLFVVWLLSLAASAAVAVLLVQIYRQSSSAQAARAETTVARACDMIAERYTYYTSGWAGPAPGSTETRLRTDLGALVSLALAAAPGVEGGVWQDGVGPLAYAFPTYAGGAAAAELPAADRAQIEAVNHIAAQNDDPTQDEYGSGTETVVLAACPLGGPVPGLTGWAMMRVAEAPGYEQLRLGLGVQLALALGLSGGLTLLVAAWTRQVRRIETVLAEHRPGRRLRLEPTGERDLDRIIGALNAAEERLDAARQKVASSERLAALGRVAAGVAHEIRNPVAAMRLKAENALAGDDARRRAVLPVILAQLARLETLAGELLAMTQQRTPAPEKVALPAFLEACAADHRERAAAAGVAIQVAAPDATAQFDPGLTRRVLDSLLDNAVRHTPSGGDVRLGAALDGATLRLTVADTGPGVSPALHGTLFEPFVTGRADGTGLGLAIAREMTEAQGGRIYLAPSAAGAEFVIEIPCRAS